MKTQKRSWVVEVKCIITKELCLDNCTKEQAFESPYDYCVQEREIDQVDYEVISVEPNE